MQARAGRRGAAAARRAAARDRRHRPSTSCSARSRRSASTASPRARCSRRSRAPELEDLSAVFQEVTVGAGRAVHHPGRRGPLPLRARLGHAQGVPRRRDRRGDPARARVPGRAGRRDGLLRRRRSLGVGARARALRAPACELRRPHRLLRERAGGRRAPSWTSSPTGCARPTCCTRRTTRRTSARRGALAHLGG